MDGDARRAAELSGPEGNVDRCAARVELGDLWLQQVHESSARLKTAEHPTDRAFIKFLPRPDQGFLVQGKPLASDSILRHSRGDSYHERTLGETRWCAISLPTPLQPPAATWRRQPTR